MHSALTHDERFLACKLIKTRFRGRAELERAAETDPVGLAKLELRLGLGTEDGIRAAQRTVATKRIRAIVDGWGAERAEPTRDGWMSHPSTKDRFGRPYDAARVARLSRVTYDEYEQALGYLLAGDDYDARERAAARRYAGVSTADAQRVGSMASVVAHVARLVAPDACEAIATKRAERAWRKALVDPLAARQPGYAADEIAKRRAVSLLTRAQFRKATHSHEDRIVLVPEGQEGAESTSDQIRPSAAGLPNAYSRKGFWVTSSTHTLRVSRAILHPIVVELNATWSTMPPRELYLSPTVRVVQGRGTSLRVERLTKRGAWK